MSDASEMKIAEDQRERLETLKAILREERLNEDDIRAEAYSEFTKLSPADLVAWRDVLDEKHRKAQSELKRAIKENSFATFGPVETEKQEAQLTADFYASEEAVAWAREVKPVEALNKRIRVRREVLEDVIEQRAVFGRLRTDSFVKQKKRNNLRTERAENAVTLLRDAKRTGDYFDSPRDLFRSMEILEGKSNDGKTIYAYYHDYLNGDMPQGIEEWASYFAEQVDEATSGDLL